MHYVKNFDQRIQNTYSSEYLLENTSSVYNNDKSAKPKQKVKLFGCKMLESLLKKL